MADRSEGCDFDTSPPLHFMLNMKLRSKIFFINSFSEVNRSLNPRPSVSDLTVIIISGFALDDNFAINPLNLVDKDYTLLFSYCIMS